MAVGKRSLPTMLDSTTLQAEYPIIHSENAGLHPIVTQWLVDNGYSSIQHEVTIAKGRRVDFTAISPAQEFTVIECKVGSNGKSNKSIAQLENYRSILKASKSIMFVSQDAHKMGFQLECEARGHEYKVADCWHKPLKLETKLLSEMIVVLSDKRPLPVLIANYWQFYLDTVPHPENTRHLLYCINDWVEGLANQNNSRHVVCMALKELPEVKVWNFKSLRSDGKRYSRRFTDTTGIYTFSQYMRTSSKTPRVGEMKKYLAHIATQMDLHRTEGTMHQIPIQLPLLVA
jgi:hypothetical protein